MAEHMRTNVDMSDADADVDDAAAAVDAVSDMLGDDSYADSASEIGNDDNMPDTPPAADGCGCDKSEHSVSDDNAKADDDGSVVDEQGRTDARKVIESGMREVEGIFDQYSDDIEFAKRKALDAFAGIKQRSVAQLNRLGVLTDDGKLTDKYKGYANKALDVADDALGAVDGALETLQKKVREKKSDGAGDAPYDAS